MSKLCILCYIVAVVYFIRCYSGGTGSTSGYGGLPYGWWEDPTEPGSGGGGQNGGIGGSAILITAGQV